jgi:hypothetical protein
MPPQEPNDMPPTQPPTPGQQITPIPSVSPPMATDPVATTNLPPSAAVTPPDSVTTLPSEPAQGPAQVSPQSAIPASPASIVTTPGTPPSPDTVAQIAAQPHSDTPDIREVYATICSQIVKEQGQIIGTLSYEQASHVQGLQINPSTYNCTIRGEPLVVLEQLVDKYRQFFGNAAVEVCREAAMHLKARLPQEQIPQLLRG